MKTLAIVRMEEGMKRRGGSRPKFLQKTLKDLKIDLDDSELTTENLYDIQDAINELHDYKHAVSSDKFSSDSRRLLASLKELGQYKNSESKKLVRLIKKVFVK